METSEVRIEMSVNKCSFIIYFYFDYFTYTQFIHVGVTRRALGQFSMKTSRAGHQTLDL